MVNINYANVYKEVLVVLNNLKKEDYEKIPKEYINFLQANCNNQYEFKYNSSNTFEEQELLDDTKYILFGLFEKFGATDIQKAKIKSFKINYNNKLEYEKREKYNTNNLFKNSEIKTKNEETKNIVSVVPYKESFFTRIKNWLKNILSN